MATIFDLAEAPASVAVERIRSGIPASAFRTLADRLGVSQNELATKLRVATRTLTRLAGERKPLPPEITEKVLRAARVMIKARTILSDDLSVVTWLNTEAPALHGVKPIDLLDTDVGASEVEGLILGLAYGNFQ
jgi:putative toxin-antitoxin system antitoxin component (TIGR02293 family)